jgi:hypothetical protein
VKAEIEKIENKLKQEWLMFELEYLKRYSYFQTDTMLLTISILSALLFYLFATVQNIFLLKLLVPILFTPLIVFLSFDTYKKAKSLINLLNSKIKELEGGR